MDEAHYKDAKEILASINMPSEYYNPSRDAPTGVDPELDGLKELMGTHFEDVIGQQVDTTANSEIMTSDGDGTAGSTSPSPSSSPSGAVDDEEAEDARRDAKTQRLEDIKALTSEAMTVRSYLNKDCAQFVDDDPTIAPLVDDLVGYARNGDRDGFELVKTDIDSKLMAWRMRNKR